MEHEDKQLISSDALDGIRLLHKPFDKDLSRTIVRLCESHLRLYESIWPGRPKFVPTPEVPQQDFYETILEGLRADAEMPFTRGLQEMREMLARFVEQGGHPEIAQSMRLNWNPQWGEDPGPPKPE